MLVFSVFFFFFNDTATTEIYTLSLHDALPISIPTWTAARSPARSSPCGSSRVGWRRAPSSATATRRRCAAPWTMPDRKSTRLNSSHGYISYAVFCLKKKKKSRKRRSHDVTDLTHVLGLDVDT